jgi:hypothetical protein
MEVQLNAIFDGTVGLRYVDAVFDYTNSLIAIHGAATYSRCFNTPYRANGALSVDFLTVFDGRIY